MDEPETHMNGVAKQADAQTRDRTADLSTYLAAERTLLAWVRTGLALMGFGFVVARFGLFLRELATLEHAAPTDPFGVSMGVGTSLVVLGVAANLCAALKHWQLVRRLDRGEPIRSGPLSLGVIVALAVSLLGVLVAVYLLFGMNHAA